ncbi:MAG: hypothetical protein WAL36_12210, partial [Pseudolabrys sp.]
YKAPRRLNDTRKWTPRGHFEKLRFGYPIQAKHFFPQAALVATHAPREFKFAPTLCLRHRTLLFLKGH